MLIGEERDNYGIPFKYIKYLKIGDKLKCIKTEKSRGDVGFSGITYEYDSFIKDKEYVVCKLYNSFAYVADEEGCLSVAKPDIFELAMEWEILDLNHDNIGLPSNMFFSFGTEINDMFYRLEYGSIYRWSIFKVCTTYFIIKQKYFSYDKKWVEQWTKQMNSDLEEVKTYAMDDYKNNC